MPPSRDAAPVPKKISTHLDALAERYETPAFIAADPIAIPHAYARAADREVAAFFAAVFAWGQRVTILNKARDFLARMGPSPHAFLLEHAPTDRAAFADFTHRTFQPADADYFLRRLQRHYREHDSLAAMFGHEALAEETDVGPALTRFHERFFDAADAPRRTRKHVATPARKSTCKRLCMLLRWMVRPADRGVDFGMWTGLHPRQLVIPIDVHVRRQAEGLGLLSRKQNDWRAAVALTERLRDLDPEDPVKYDFALFGLGVDKADS